MRSVLYVINSLTGGGAEKGLVELVKAGAFDGFDLHVATLTAPSGPHAISLTDLGVRPIGLTSRPKVDALTIVAAAYALRKTLGRLKPDALILSLPQTNVIGRLLSIGRKWLVCSFEHNTHLSRRSYEWAYRVTSRRVDWMLADSDATAAAARARLYRSAPQATYVLPLIAFDAAQVPTRQFRRGGSPFRLVSAGRLTRVKNHAVLIGAVHLLRMDGQDVTLTVYGDGPERLRLEELVQRRNLTEIVTLPGFVSDWTSAGGDLFVLPSRHEGLSIVTLEAMSLGLPVLATRVGGVADHGEAVATVEPDRATPDALAAAISALIADRASLDRLQVAGPALIRRRYSREACATLLAGFREALLKRLETPAPKPFCRPMNQL